MMHIARMVRPALATSTAIFAASCASTPTTTGDAAPPTCSTAHCITTVVGNGTAAFGDDRITGWQSAIYTPQDGIVDKKGMLYYIDWNNHRIRTWDPTTGLTTTIAGTGELGDLGGGEPALDGRMNHPTGLAFAPNGDLLIAAWHNSKIKRINMATGIMDDICGTGARAYAGDGVVGGAPKAKMDLPSAIVVDAVGNMFISDQANQRIRKVDTQDTMTTVVGDVWFTASLAADGTPCTDDGGNFTNCKGKVLVSKDGAVWTYDDANDKVGHAQTDATGAPVKFTGFINGRIPDLNGGYSGDGGPALHARLQSPKSQSASPAARIAIDVDKNLIYIADSGNNCVRLFDVTAGTIDTFAGKCASDNSTAGFGGDGGDAKAALLNQPTDVDLLPDGGLLIADKENHCVRVVRAGKIATFAGQCTQLGFAGDGGDAGAALLNRPYGTAVAADGTVYVMDSHNHRVRAVRP